MEIQDISGAVGPPGGTAALGFGFVIVHLLRTTNAAEGGEVTVFQVWGRSDVNDATRWNGKDRILPCEGYLFAALEMDESETPPVAYRQESDPKSGRVHNTDRFGFVAFPAEPGVTGRFVYIVNENCTIFRRDLPCPVPRNWPTDNEIIRFWLSAGRGSKGVHSRARPCAVTIPVLESGMHVHWPRFWNPPAATPFRYGSA
jgi:hypothetical protein